MEQVSLTFNYTKEEFIKAEKKYLLASKAISKIHMVFVAGYFIFSAAYLFASSASLTSIVCLTIASLALALGVFLYFASPSIRFKQTAKYYEQYTLTFSKDLIHFKTPSINSELSWSIYSELWETAQFYYMIQGKRMYTLLPKRVFKSDGEIKAFEALAEQHFKQIRQI